MLQHDPSIISPDKILFCATSVCLLFPGVAEMCKSVFQIISSCVISYIKSVILKLIFENKTLGTQGTAAVLIELLIVLHLHSFSLLSFCLTFLFHLINTTKKLLFSLHNAG
jgi:hypothetical protein